MIRKALAACNTRAYMIRGRLVRLEDAYQHFANKGKPRRYWQEHEFPEDSTTPSDVWSITPSGVGTPLTPAASAGSSLAAQLEAVDGQLERVGHEQLMDDCVRAAQLDIQTLPSTPTPSLADRSLSALCHSTRTYFSSRFEAGAWVLPTTEHDRDDSFYPSARFGGRFLEFDNTRRQKNYAQGQTIIDSTLDMVDELLRVQDSRLVTYFLEGLAFCRANGHDSFAFAVNARFAARARQICGPKHPLFLFSYALLCADPDAQRGYIEVALTSQLHQFLASLRPPQHVETMRLLLTGAMILKHLKCFGAAASFYKTLLEMYVASYGHLSYQTVHCMVDMAHLSLSRNDLDDASVSINGAMQLAGRISHPTERVESMIRSLVCLATMQEIQGDLAGKERRLESATDLGHEADLPRDHWMMRDLRARRAEGSLSGDELFQYP